MRRAIVTRRDGRLTRRGGLALALAASLSGGCGGEVPLGDPPPPLSEDATLAAQVAAMDQVDGVVPRLNAFVHGEPVHYWIFGEAPASSMELHRLCRRTADGCVPIPGYPPVAAALPGDPGYSPYGRVSQVAVTGAWDGRRFASVEDVRAGVDAGMLEPPERLQVYRHCPIVAEGVTLEVDVGLTVAPTPVYARGFEARCFDFTDSRGERDLLPDGTMFIRNVYVLTREGETAPLNELARMEDLTGDGDTVDSNNIFGVGIDDDFYTPLWRVVTVTVPAGYASIDTGRDQGRADYRRSEDMFDVAPDYTITPLDGQIVGYEETDTLLDCPLQSAPGGL